MSLLGLSQARRAPQPRLQPGHTGGWRGRRAQSNGRMEEGFYQLPCSAIRAPLSPPQGASPFLGATGLSNPLPSMVGTAAGVQQSPLFPPLLPDIVWQDVGRLVGAVVTHMGGGIWELGIPPPNSGHQTPTLPKGPLLPAHPSVLRSL